MSNAAEYVIFAARFGIKPNEAHVLPALFEHSAAKVNMPVRALIAEATYRNNPLGQYMAACARKVAQECPR